MKIKSKCVRRECNRPFPAMFISVDWLGCCYWVPVWTCEHQCMAAMLLLRVAYISQWQVCRNNIEKQIDYYIHLIVQVSKSSHILVFYMHAGNMRTKCPAPLRSLMCQRPLGIYFSAPCFFLSSPLWSAARGCFGLSDMCVCGRAREGGVMPFLHSLHFGIRTGSGLNRGNMTSSLPPPSFYHLTFFLLFTLPPFVHPSPSKSAPRHSQASLVAPDTLQAVTRSHDPCL